MSDSKKLLAAEKIKAAIPPELWKLIPVLHILNKIDSTNTYVLNYSTRGAKSGFTCLAEQQTAGRGRWGRTWVSPYASHLYLSMLWQFPTTHKAKELSGLSLVMGVAIANVLKQLGVCDKLGLKWPNDVYWGYEKIAGVLIEMSGVETSGIETSKNCAVIGIGLNVHMPEKEGVEINQPWTDLYTILGVAPDRNLIAGLMIAELLRVLPCFSKYGLAAFLNAWQSLDIHYKKAITVQTSAAQYSGIACGVNAEGELMIQCDDGIERNFHSAEVLPSAKLN